MKLHIKKGLFPSIALLLIANSGYAAHTVPVPAVAAPTFTSPGKVYVGVFGGGGSTNHIDVSQFGTAYYFEALGGPLAVNAFGHTNHHSFWLAGGQIGYQVPALLDPNTQWTLSPAGELEGFYMGRNTFSGQISNEEATGRLAEHDFDVSYRLERAVFLANAVLNLNIPCYGIHPYIGAGFGGAVIKVTGADATQINPVEEGINHYNSKNSDITPTFAGQVKAGVSFDFNDCFSVFAEYRWLYLSSTHYSFGSTTYPGHPQTSHWQVTLDPQYSNIGTVGLRVNL